MIEDQDAAVLRTACGGAMYGAHVVPSRPGQLAVSVDSPLAASAEGARQVQVLPHKTYEALQHVL